MPAASRWRPRATSREPFRPISDTRTSSTRCAIPSCPLPASRTFGDDVAAQLFGVRSQIYMCRQRRKKIVSVSCLQEVVGRTVRACNALRSFGQYDDGFGPPSGFGSVLPRPS
jgi:hypothetical protein